MVPEPVTWTADEDGIKFDVRIEPLSAIGFLLFFKIIN